MAGKRIDVVGGGSWIRPVSTRIGEELTESERSYLGQVEPQLLDVIQAEILLHKPTLHQQENWVIDPTVQFVKTHQLSPSDAIPLVDPVFELWENGVSSYNGTNDRFPENLAGKFSDSLKILYVDELTIGVESGYQSPKKVARGHFQYNGNQYGLRITDPVIEDIYISKPAGRYDFGNCLLTISLGEKPFERYFYKYLAGIISLKGLSI